MQQPFLVSTYASSRGNEDDVTPKEKARILQRKLEDLYLEVKEASHANEETFYGRVFNQNNVAKLVYYASDYQIMNVWAAKINWEDPTLVTGIYPPSLSSNDSKHILQPGLFSRTSSAEESICSFDLKNEFNRLDIDEVEKRRRENSGFTSYMSLPWMYGYDKLPPLIHHCSVLSNTNVIFTFGGLMPIFDSNDIRLDLSRFVVDGIHNLPDYISENTMNNPTMVPNTDMYGICTSSNTVLKLDLLGDIPPPLLRATVSQLTDRHLAYYGGFQRLSHSYKKDGKIHIKFEIKMNPFIYLFDILTHRFTKHSVCALPSPQHKEVMVRPTFGHSHVSFQCDPKTKLKSLLILGGYTQTENGDYKTVKDFWKIDLTISKQGKRSFFKFAEVAYATSISNDGPGARAFHAAGVYDSQLLYGKDYTEDKGYGILVVQGGGDDEYCYGDLWWMNLGTYKWSKIDTHAHILDEKTGAVTNERFQVQCRRMGHRGVQIGNFMVFIGGSLMGSLKDQDPDLPCVCSISRGITQDHVEAKKYAKKVGNICFLDLQTQTWLLIKYDMHLKVPFRSPKAENKNCRQQFNDGSQAVSSGSRVFIIGGELDTFLDVEKNIQKRVGTSPTKLVSSSSSTSPLSLEKVTVPPSTQAKPDVLMGTMVTIDFPVASSSISSISH